MSMFYEGCYVMRLTLRIRSKTYQTAEKLVKNHGYYNLNNA